MLQIVPFFKKRRNFIKCLFAAPLIVETNVIRSQNMVNINKHFISFVKYWGDLGAGIGMVAMSPKGGPYFGEQGGPQITGSEPVPVQYKGQIQIAYLVYTYLIFPRPRRIFPPQKVEWFDPTSGKLTAEAPVTPAYFGQKDDPDKPLKGLIKSPSMSIETHGKLRDRMFVLYDVLFPIWATNPATSDQTGLRSQASEFLKVFDQVCEQPLRPYYYSLGRDWFGWLRELAK